MILEDNKEKAWVENPKIRNTISKMITVLWCQRKDYTLF